MKRNDTVFFFVLVDFFLQLSFLGVIFFAMDRPLILAVSDTRLPDQEKVRQFDSLTTRTGISDLVELTDQLTRLIPADSSRGGALISIIASLRRLTSDAGGVDSVIGAMARLRKLEAGSGKPPCRYTFAGAKRVSISVAGATLTDSAVVFQPPSAQFTSLLDSIGVSVRQNRSYSLSEFQSVFAGLRRLHPECLFRLDVRIETNLLAPVDAAWSAFSVERRLAQWPTTDR